MNANSLRCELVLVNAELGDPGTLTERLEEACATCAARLLDFGIPVELAGSTLIVDLTGQQPADRISASAIVGGVLSEKQLTPIEGINQFNRWSRADDNA